MRLAVAKSAAKRVVLVKPLSKLMNLILSCPSTELQPPSTMPAATSLPNVSKKRKREMPTQENDSDTAILLLEEQILASRKNYNQIATLLDDARRDDDEEAAHRTLVLVVLCRIFCKMMVLGSLSTTRQSTENERAVVQWLNDRFKDYKGILLSTFSQPGAGMQSTALTLLIKLVKEEAEHLKLSEELIWRHGTFAVIVEKLVRSEMVVELREEFVQKYVQEFDDVRFYTFGRLRLVSFLMLCHGCLDSLLTELWLQMKRMRTPRIVLSQC